MGRSVAIWILSYMVIFLTHGCLDPYNASTSRPDFRTLVVDGFLDGSDSTCSVQLSRVVALDMLQSPPIEMGAKVMLVNESGSSYLLIESLAGTYTGSQLPFAVGSKIKLEITTKDQTEYQSDMVTILKAPMIDSVTWGAGRTGVPIYISTHNGETDSRCYYWKYTETWSYKSGFQTAVKLDANLNIVTLSENIFQCWNTALSSDILVASSSVLENNTGVISRIPLVIVPWESPKLQDRYSMLVEQRAISKDTYDYLQQLKKNTENLGTLFDPLPSQPTGNIHCLTNSNQLALGNFMASTVQKKRIYVNYSELSWPAGTASATGYEGCALYEIRMRSDWTHFVPVGNGSNQPVMGTTPFCVDCRLLGGTNIKPDFWEW